MPQTEAAISSEERNAIAVKAVNRLIADVEAKRLLESKELAEVIKVCIRETQPRLLRDLKFVLDQQELNRPELKTVRRLFVAQFPAKNAMGVTF